MKPNRVHHMAGLMMAGVLATTLGACAALPPPLAPSTAASDGYALGPGDKLRITVYNEPTMTGEYAVSASGTVAFPLIGSVNARNMTLEALQDGIRAKLAGGGYVKDPRVSVEVLNYRPYYILGEVNRPGEYPYSAGISIEQAVAAAGGFTYRAQNRHLFVRRARQDGERSVDLRGPTVEVLPGDTIRVGERYF